MPAFPRFRLLSLLLAFSAPALAAQECPPAAKLVFECLTEKGKRIQVCDAGHTLVYSFGKPEEKPEIIVQAPRPAVTTYQWPGMGRYMTYALDIPNGSTRYSVFWSQDKHSPGKGAEAGVDVENNDVHLATVKCAKNARIIQAIAGMNVKPRN